MVASPFDRHFLSIVHRASCCRSLPFCSVHEPIGCNPSLGVCWHIISRGHICSGYIPCILFLDGTLLCIPLLYSWSVHDCSILPVLWFLLTAHWFFHFLFLPFCRPSFLYLLLLRYRFIFLLRANPLGIYFVLAVSCSLFPFALSFYFYPQFQSSRH